MKKDIHPDYVECKVTCSCGNTFITRSTKSEIKVDLCNGCHPFYTGQQKFVDTGGRVQRFQDKFGAASEATFEREAQKKEARRLAQEAADEKRKAERAAKAEEKAQRAAEYAAKAAKLPKAEEVEEAAAEAVEAAEEVAEEAVEAAKAVTEEATEAVEGVTEEAPETTEE